MTDRGPRRRLEPDARREQILGCAVRLFGQRSYEEVSTAEVAGSAGVARGLVHHYFGTKKQLYLEVVRVLVTVPEAALDAVGRGDLDHRVDEAVTWFLDTVSRHAEPWLAAIGASGPSRNPDVAAVIAQADEDTVSVILRLAGEETSDDEEMRAALRAYVSFARTGAVEWLVRGSLTKWQVHTLLSRTLVGLLSDTIATVRSAGPTPVRSRSGS